MPQLHCYVAEKIATKLQQKADQENIPVSKYVAQLIKKDIEPEWPEGYFELFGSFSDEPLQRPQDGQFEQRETLL